METEAILSESLVLNATETFVWEGPHSIWQTGTWLPVVILTAFDLLLWLCWIGGSCIGFDLVIWKEI